MILGVAGPPPWPEHVVLVFLLFAPLFGACVGSFLNVVVYRLPRERSLWRPGSHCYGCGTLLPWHENIPMLSYLLLRGRCRHCAGRISPLYFWTEALTAGLFALLVWAFFERRLAFARFAGPPVWPAWQETATLVVTLLFVSALVASSLIDLRHRIIPDEISVYGSLLVPLVAAVVPALVPRLTEVVRPLHLAGFASSALGALVGAGTLYFVGKFGRLIFRKEAMGMGDVKLMGLIGGMLGWDGVLLTLFIACLVGSLVGIVLLLIYRDHYMPFGPFLAVGALVVLLFRQDLLHWLNLFLTGRLWVAGH